MIETLVENTHTTYASTDESGDRNCVVLVGEVVDSDSVEVFLRNKGPEQENNWS